MTYLNPRQFNEPLYHASPNAIKPGTIIRPAEFDWAWAGNKPRADHHAITYLSKGHFGGRSRRDQAEQLAFFHPVYKVEPLKTDKTFEHVTDGQPYDEQKTYRSKKGLRVKGFSHFAGPTE